MYATRNDFYYRLDTAPNGRVYIMYGRKDLELALVINSISSFFSSLDEMKKEGFEIHRTMDGLSVGDLIVNRLNGEEFRVVSRSGYGDLSLVVIVYCQGSQPHMLTIKEIKNKYTVKEPLPEKCKACGK